MRTTFRLVAALMFSAMSAACAGDVLAPVGAAAPASSVGDSPERSATGEATPDVCGDGIAQGSEACDGLDLRGLGCGSFGFVGGQLACLATCLLDATQCVTPSCATDPAECEPPPRSDCGNGVVEDGEECDLGNAFNVGPPSFCNADCTASVPCPSGTWLTPSGSCEPDTRQARCEGLPALGVANVAEVIEQRWDGQKWQPAATYVYDVAPATDACHYVCRAGYVYDGRSCTTVVVVHDDPVANDVPLCTFRRELIDDGEWIRRGAPNAGWTHYTVSADLVPAPNGVFAEAVLRGNGKICNLPDINHEPLERILDNGYNTPYFSPASFDQVVPPPAPGDFGYGIVTGTGTYNVSCSYELLEDGVLGSNGWYISPYQWVVYMSIEGACD